MLRLSRWTGFCISWSWEYSPLQVVVFDVVGDVGPARRATLIGKTVMPVSYLGNQGVLNGLSVGDGFFHRLGATVAERTYCDSGACTAYASTIGATAGVDPESLVHSRYIILWATNTISTHG